MTVRVGNFSFERQFSRKPAMPVSETSSSGGFQTLAFLYQRVAKPL